MNIYGKIVTAMVAFETLTGKRPALIYAGEKEVAELKKWCGDALPMGASVTHETVTGLAIVEVKDESFLSVGIKI